MQPRARSDLICVVPDQASGGLIGDVSRVNAYLREEDVRTITLQFGGACCDGAVDALAAFRHVHMRPDAMLSLGSE